jgi:hypothetical protein
MTNFSVVTMRWSLVNTFLVVTAVGHRHSATLLTATN